MSDPPASRMPLFPRFYLLPQAYPILACPRFCCCAMPLTPVTFLHWGSGHISQNVYITCLSVELNPEDLHQAGPGHISQNKWVTFLPAELYPFLFSVPYDTCRLKPPQLVPSLPAGPVFYPIWLSSLRPRQYQLELMSDPPVL